MLIADVPTLLNSSQQMMLVIADDWNTPRARLQAYQRQTTATSWQAIGPSIAVVVGKEGMAWDSTFAPTLVDMPIKREGDARTPVGVFSLGKVFGFAPNADALNLKMPYLPLKGKIVCVDDPHSGLYNQVLDSAEIAVPDWNSAEKMPEEPLYQWGIVVNYNFPDIRQNRGSCIFMHIWRGPESGTAGCIAIEEIQLKNLITWLDPTKSPVIVTLPQSAYQELHETWHLPHFSVGK